MPFMEPQAQELVMFVLETTAGTESVPVEFVGEDARPDDLRDYIEGEPLEDAELEREQGWYARFSAPGYMDCTDWVGPCGSAEAAFDELAEVHDVCRSCWECCWDSSEGDCQATS